MEFNNGALVLTFVHPMVDGGFHLLYRIVNIYKIFGNTGHIFMIKYSGARVTDGKVWRLAVTIISNDRVGCF